VRLKGRVRELDADYMRFGLRDIDGGGPNRECTFDLELWDDVHDLLGEDALVEVIGVETSPNSPIKVAFLGRIKE